MRIGILTISDRAADAADADWLPVYGGEAVRVGGEVVSRLRSVTYGHSLRRMVGYVYLPTHLAEGSEVEIEVLGRAVRGIVVPDALVDPGGQRMRG